RGPMGRLRHALVPLHDAGRYDIASDRKASGDTSRGKPALAHNRPGSYLCDCRPHDYAAIDDMIDPPWVLPGSYRGLWLHAGEPASALRSLRRVAAAQS